MSNLNNNPLESYISKIDTIEEGKRNNRLYRVGCRLRAKFGLRGGALLVCLGQINTTKCRVPLVDAEVDKIAASVDRSNIPLGSPSAPRTGQQSKQASAPKSRIVYAVSVSDVPVAVTELLQKNVSLYADCMQNIPSGTATVANVLEMFRVGEHFRSRIEAIRNEPDKEKRNEAKRKLPAVVLGSEPQTQRNTAACKPNGLICLDFDHIPADGLENAKQAIAAIPYVFAVALSVSGNGLFALAAYDGTPDLKKLLQAMQAGVAYEIDKARSDLCGLRYVTYDPDMIVKDEVFPAIPTERTEESEKEVESMLVEATIPVIILNPKKPVVSADKFIETHYTFNGIPTLIHYADGYWHWRGNAYYEIEDGVIKSQLLHFAERAKVAFPSKEGDDSFPVESAKLNMIEDMVKRRVFQPARETLPCWIGGASCEMPPSVIDYSQLIFGKSTILNLADMGVLSPTPHWLNTAALDFDYDANAECPQWLKFLGEVFEEDEESKQTLMEWMGLCLTTITKFQKALFLVGKIRSGKGSIGRILHKIVGKHNAVAAGSTDFGKDFGLQPFIGKTFAITSDTRLGKHIPMQLVERILSITGEDMVLVNRKNKAQISLRLQTKIMLISNEIPNILDQSGALASRFIFLNMPKSYKDIEDVELEEKLSSELPGILRLAIQHLQNLLKRGRFIQPESGKKVAERMAALSSPVGVFAKQLQPYMSKDEIWTKWVEFTFAEGMGHGKKGDLWNNLESAGYDCDFDTADILAKIRELGGEASVQQLKDGIAKYHVKGGSDTLKAKLKKMVDTGILSVRVGERNVKYYNIVNAPPDNPDVDDDVDVDED